MRAHSCGAPRFESAGSSVPKCNMCDLYPMHSNELIVTVDKNTVVARHPFEPRGCSMNNFLLHAIVVTRITGGVESHGCMVEGMDTTGKSWTAVVRVFMSAAVVQLFTQKMIEELRKLRYIEFMS